MLCQYLELVDQSICRAIEMLTMIEYVRELNLRLELY